MVISRTRHRVWSRVARGAPDDPRGFLRSLQPIGPVHAPPHGKGRSRGTSGGGADQVLPAQQAPPPVRPEPLRARERERDLSRHRRALRADRGHGRAIARAVMLKEKGAVTRRRDACSAPPTPRTTSAPTAGGCCHGGVPRGLPGAASPPLARSIPG